ncbi:MAG: hypothetical protein AB6733_07920 [Clostridiaceae bacterium]
MYFKKEKQEIICNYIEKSMSKNMLNDQNCLNIIKAFIEYLDDYYSKQSYDNLANTLWKNHINHVKDIFEDEEYTVLKLILGDNHGLIFKSIWNKATEYTYYKNIYKSPYRTNKFSKMYLKKNVDKLIEYIYLSATEFSLKKYLQDNEGNYIDEYKNISVISDIIAFEVDRNNMDIIEKVKAAFYWGNDIPSGIFNGLIKCKNPEGHKLLVDYILSIDFNDYSKKPLNIESIEEFSEEFFSYMLNDLGQKSSFLSLINGSAESFIYIFKSILDNKLMKFPPIANAFGGWTKLVLDINNQELVNKSFITAYNCIVDENYRNYCINSNDSLLIYIGIWSAGFYEVDNIYEVIEKLLLSNKKNKRIVALQFLSNNASEFEILKHQVACKMLSEDDLEINVLAIKNLFEGLFVEDVSYIVKDENYYNCKLKEYSHGIELFNKLKVIVDKLSKHEVEINSSLFPWVSLKLTINDIISKMMLSIALSYTSEEVDTLIEYLDKMKPSIKQVFIRVFLKNPKNSKQKSALIETCIDINETLRNNAFIILNSLALTKEDFSKIENLLLYKSKHVRKKAIKLLLKQSSEDLSETVRNLSSSNNENKRFAAIYLVSDLKENGEHKKIYNQCINSLMTMKDISPKEMGLIRKIIKY